MKLKTFSLAMIALILALPAFARADEGAPTGTAVPLERINLLKDRIGTSSEAMKSQRQKIKEEIKKRIEARKALASKFAEAHRSEVATYIKSLLDVADRQSLGGLGDRVREIAKAQNDAEEQIGPALDKVKSRNKAAKFFFGADMTAIKEAKDRIKDAQKQLADLDKAKDEAVSAEDKAALETQIANMKTSYGKILTDIQAEEGRTGIFGWLKKFMKK